MAYYYSKSGYGRRRRKSPLRKFIFFTLILFILLAVATAFFVYRALFSNNVWLDDREKVSVYIPTGSDYEDVKSELYGKGLIVNRRTFEWVARQKDYPVLVKPGHYVINKGMSNNEVVDMLRSGIQEPVNVLFNNVRGVKELASSISLQIEADSASLTNLMTDSTYLSKMGLSEATATTIFIPNTYEFYWTTTAKQFIERMYLEYKSFWNKDRLAKAADAGLSITEVIILASIVEKETTKDDEKPAIAGVYMNRLKRGWRLQADPTLIYAMQDFSIRRVLNKHKEIDSPYNTYQNPGLPPGPICIPSITSINAVLNFEDHGYLFFCAKDDLSGYHEFSKTTIQHNRNARKYQRALDAMDVWK